MATDANAAAAPAKRGAFTRFLNTVEWLGNLLPHPVSLFALFALAVLVASGLLSWLASAWPTHARRAPPDGPPTA